jgi:hypothetical protein
MHDRGLGEGRADAIRLVQYFVVAGKPCHSQLLRRLL